MEMVTLSVLMPPVGQCYLPAYGADLNLLSNASKKLIPRLSTLATRGNKMLANVLCLSPDKVISIAKNRLVNERRVRLGFKAVTAPSSKVIKSGGSV
jgi:hypothetical protein